MTWIQNDHNGYPKGLTSIDGTVCSSSSKNLRGRAAELNASALGMNAQGEDKAPLAVRRLKVGHRLPQLHEQSMRNAHYRQIAVRNGAHAANKHFFLEGMVA